MYEHTRLGDEVLALHSAFVEAASDGSVVYTPTAQSASDINQFTLHHEEELAFVDILVCAVPPLPSALLERTLEVARRLWVGEPDQTIYEHVEAWIRWSPDSGLQPPYTT